MLGFICDSSFRWLRSLFNLYIALAIDIFAQWVWFMAHFADHSWLEIECWLSGLILQSLLILYISDLRCDSLLSKVFASHICVNHNHVFESTIGKLGFLEFFHLRRHYTFDLSWCLCQPQVSALRARAIPELARQLHHLTWSVIDLAGHGGYICATLSGWLDAIVLRIEGRLHRRVMQQADWLVVVRTSGLLSHPSRAHSLLLLSSVNGPVERILEAEVALGAALIAGFNGPVRCVKGLGTAV